ncbi:Aste57867_1378 [Aphanomyces stellatus]|uniref:Palmitoyltransferase n=1 Tax=Aphanomyces stellatus TaxID=120398 RepID=A0A485K4Z2_9STRA|nr:hypothetical protein As57867_001377 [Aphanomyces stellatus]VFT78596.1 Aste57867_1378 [Aphanomyces stellatus]
MLWSRRWPALEMYLIGKYETFKPAQLDKTRDQLLLRADWSVNFHALHYSFGPRSIGGGLAMRQNGFQVPFDLFQVTAWISFPILVGGFYAFFIPFLPQTSAVALGVVYGVNALVGVTLTAITTSINPADRNVLNQVDIHPTQVTEDHLYCNVCTQYVDKKSRHCRICEKCVAHFDHHCKWLNNCIGEHNYRYFFTLIVSMLLLTTIQLVLGLYLFIQAFTASSDILTHAASSYGCASNVAVAADGLCPGAYSFSLVAIKVVLGIYLAILVPSFLPIAQLVYFHIKLYFLQLTTYDYIIQQRRVQLGQEANPEPFKCTVTCNCRTAPTEPEPTPVPPILPKSTTMPMLTGFGHPSSVHVQDTHSSHETKSPVSPSQREDMTYEPMATPGGVGKSRSSFFV